METIRAIGAAHAAHTIEGRQNTAPALKPMTSDNRWMQFKLAVREMCALLITFPHP